MAVAIVGTLNPSSGDVSLFLPLEHSMLAQSTPESVRTSWFARYSLVGALLAATGALCAGAPQWLAQHDVAVRSAYPSMFVLYALIGVACAACYRRLPVRAADAATPTSAPLRESRRVVMTLAALFSLDAFAGGLIVQSMLALWLFERFALSPATTGVIFFWTGVLSAFSYLVAVRIANRIGLVYTMVFTQCANGKDDDGDGKIDGNDLGCSSPTDNLESDDPVSLRASKVITVPAKPKAGKLVVVGALVLRLETGAGIPSGTVKCAVKVGLKALPARGKVSSGVAACAFTLPKASKGKMARGTIGVTFKGKSVKVPFAFKVN